MSEDVQDMIRKGIAFLSSQEHPDLRESVLIGTAAYKAEFRYSNTDPKAHPLVVSALERVDKATAGGEDITRRNDFGSSNYGPAILIVFLLDIDAEGYTRVIDQALDFLLKSQQASGGWGYLSYDKNGDISQMQYIGLALWLAAKSGFDVPVDVGKDALEWMVRVQDSSGGWMYTIPPIRKPKETDTEIRHSMVAAGAGTVYVLAEWLQLASGQSVEARKRRESAQLVAELELKLPPAVMEYNPEAPDDYIGSAKVKFDLTQLRSCMARSNGWLRNKFVPNPKKYPFYYLYAFERYASLRELVDGEVTGIPDWYDQGVEWLKTQQRTDGSFPPGGQEVNSRVATALAILFLTRSMQLSIAAKVSGTLQGGEGFDDGELVRGKNGQLQSSNVEKSIEQMAAFLDGDSEQSEEEIKRVLEYVIANSSEQSVSARMSDMRDMLRRKDPELRLLAVEILGKYRNLDNVPALLFALSDPDEYIAAEAHKGLEFISRKVGVYQLGTTPEQTDFRILKKRWTAWYLSIRPDARLYDDSE